MNTSKYVPYDCIAKNVFLNNQTPEFPGIGGTGFFVKFPPYDDIFYVTARHCIYDSNNHGDPETLRVHVSNTRKEFVTFDVIIESDPNIDDIQDVIIFHVDKSNPKDVLDLLNTRALDLWHQDQVDALIKLTVETEQKFRTVGFPDVNSDLDYQDQGPHLELKARGFYGIAAKSHIPDHFSIINTNWQHEYHGFSGSPILIFTPKVINPEIDPEIAKNLDLDKEDVHVIVIGILLMGSREYTGIHFININIATNSIANYFKKFA